MRQRARRWGWRMRGEGPLPRVVRRIPFTHLLFLASKVHMLLLSFIPGRPLKAPRGFGFGELSVGDLLSPLAALRGARAVVSSRWELVPCRVLVGLVFFDTCLRMPPPPHPTNTHTRPEGCAFGDVVLLPRFARTLRPPPPTCVPPRPLCPIPPLILPVRSYPYPTGKGRARNGARVYVRSIQRAGLCYYTHAQGPPREQAKKKETRQTHPQPCRAPQAALAAPA